MSKIGGQDSHQPKRTDQHLKPQGAKPGIKSKATDKIANLIARNIKAATTKTASRVVRAKSWLATKASDFFAGKSKTIQDRSIAALKKDAAQSKLLDFSHKLMQQTTPITKEQHTELQKLTDDLPPLDQNEGWILEDAITAQNRFLDQQDAQAQKADTPADLQPNPEPQNVDQSDQYVKLPSFNKTDKTEEFQSGEDFEAAVKEAENKEAESPELFEEPNYDQLQADMQNAQEASLDDLDRKANAMDLFDEAMQNKGIDPNAQEDVPADLQPNPEPQNVDQSDQYDVMPALGETELTPTMSQATNQVKEIKDALLNPQDKVNANLTLEIDDLQQFINDLPTDEAKQVLNHIQAELEDIQSIISQAEDKNPGTNFAFAEAQIDKLISDLGLE